MGREEVSINGITKVILLALGASAVVGVALAFPGAGILHKAFTREKWERARKRGSLKATLNRLERQKLVAWKEKNGQLVLTLTEKGREKILQYNIDDLMLKSPASWDGWWRIIIFDIPEHDKPARELFREKLIQLGLIKLQRSVFVTKIPCKDEVDFLAHNYGIHRYVTYIRAKEISGLK